MKFPQNLLLPLCLAALLAACARPTESDAIRRLRLAANYANGEGVPKDDADRAVRWYRLAAEQGDAETQYNLGFAYHFGEGVSQDMVEAYAWFSLAAAQNDTIRESLRDRMLQLETIMTASQLMKAQKRSRDYRKRYVVPFR